MMEPVRKNPTECELRQRSLNVKRGFCFRTEKTFPLEKIQDLTLREGPLLNYFGISQLSGRS